MLKQWMKSVVLSAALAPLPLLAQAAPATTQPPPPPAQAQTTMQSGAGANSEGGAQVQPAKVYGDIIRVLQQEIIAAAQAMPEPKYAFAPPASAGNFSGVRTFAQQVQHVTEANYNFVKNFSVGSDVPKAKIDALTTKSDLVQALTDSFDRVLKLADSTTPSNAFTAVTTGARPQTRAGNLTFCIAHAMDHYGQMVEYLRMNGIVPPASQPRPGARND